MTNQIQTVMTESCDRMASSLRKLGAALGPVADALSEWVRAMSELCVAVVEYYDKGWREVLADYTAVEWAKKHRPGWAHRALYAKKRRVRKKYMNRIRAAYHTKEGDK